MSSDLAAEKVSPPESPQFLRKLSISRVQVLVFATRGGYNRQCCQREGCSHASMARCQSSTGIGRQLVEGRGC